MKLYSNVSYFSGLGFLFYSTKVCHSKACFVRPLVLSVSLLGCTRYSSVDLFGRPRLYSCLHLSFLSFFLWSTQSWLGLQVFVRWRSAWLSCTCGPPGAHCKSMVKHLSSCPISFCLLSQSFPLFSPFAVTVCTSVSAHFVFTPSLKAIRPHRLSPFHFIVLRCY